MKKNFTLDESHKRNITSSISYVEELLYEIKSSLYNKKGIFFKIINDIDKSQSEKIKCKIEEIFKKIKRLKDELQLTKKEIISSTIISSRCVAIWEDLCDVESKKLKRYGEISKEFSEYFDPIIKELIKDNDEILDLVKKKKQ